MSDLIKREDAIEAVLLALDRGDILDIISSLPSAEPQGELISRADAIEAVCRTRCGDKAKGCPAHSCLVIEEFDALLSADAVHGEWKFVDNEIFAGEYFCSICGKLAEVDLYGEWILSNYCPQCGARMKGGAE